MKYVELDGRVGDLTGVLDPGPYLERLSVLGGRLPPGARAFAADPDHYDFSGRRCVKGFFCLGRPGESGTRAWSPLRAQLLEA